MPAWSAPWSAWPHRPRSIRARVTLLALGVIGPLLLIALVASAAVLHQLIDGQRTDTAAAAASRVVAEANQGRLPDPIPVKGEVLLVQVVSGGRVVAASGPLEGGGPIAGVRPLGPGERNDSMVCGQPEPLPDCVNVVAYGMESNAYGRATVYAAVSEPWIVRTSVLESVMGGLAIVVLAVVAWGTWRSVGRTLRPVGRIEEEMAEITASDLSRRMPVPETRDEVERLARTMNKTLNRLEWAVDQQRRFVADASHELRTPITGLRTRIELALADPEDTDPMETLRAALSDVDRLHQIVEALLSMARLDSGVKPARARLDLGTLVETEVARDVPAVPVPVRVDAERDVLVEANRLQMSRVLLNLVANAGRHAVTGVDVVVRADRDEAVLEVRDDGAGIPRKVREQVFERFTRLDTARSRDTGGSGLGLPIAREIAQSHGGRLYVGESEHGARLVLRLPLLRDRQDDPGPGPAPGSERD